MDVVWDDLHSFLCVSRSGSFLGAAKELGVEHTTVSRRLNRLERSLGRALLHRVAAVLACLGKVISASSGWTRTELAELEPILDRR